MFEENSFSIVPVNFFALACDCHYLNKKDLENAKVEIERVFSKEIDFKTQSLSILLSFYELLFRNELKNERTKFLDDRIESFIKVILNSIDSNFEQPYMVLEKLSSHLGYLQKESFNGIQLL